jgi:hypothetical protein
VNDPGVVITGTGRFDGLIIDGGGAIVENLVMGGFGRAAISLESGNNTIENDYLGTDASGTVAMPMAMESRIPVGTTSLKTM